MRGTLKNVSTRPVLERGERDAFFPSCRGRQYLEYNDGLKITNQGNTFIDVYLYPRHCPLPSIASLLDLCLLRDISPV